MKPEFSEFTYGFALVNELSNALTCKVVPIFPSLREEGKKGGYDVQILSKRGMILNLQFKLSECLNREYAREFKLLSDCLYLPGHCLSLPYYRFKITSRRISQQHSLLQTVETQDPLTYYVAPNFHLTDDINNYWNSGQVAEHSVFVKPSSIGDLSDDDPHRVCFDKCTLENNRAFLFSDPKLIEINTFSSFSEFVSSQVEQGEILARSIERSLKNYASVIELRIGITPPLRVDPDSIEIRKQFDEREILPILPILLERIHSQLQVFESDRSNPHEGANLLRLFAEVSTIFGGVQAIALIF